MYLGLGRYAVRSWFCCCWNSCRRFRWSLAGEQRAEEIAGSVKFLRLLFRLSQFRLNHTLAKMSAPVGLSVQYCKFLHDLLNGYRIHPIVHLPLRNDGIRIPTHHMLGI